MVEYLIGSMVVMLFILSVVNRYYYIETLGAFSNLQIMANAREYAVVVSNYRGGLLRGSISLRLTVTNKTNVAETYSFRFHGVYMRKIPYYPVTFSYFKLEDESVDNTLTRRVTPTLLPTLTDIAKLSIERYILDIIYANVIKDASTQIAANGTFGNVKPTRHIEITNPRPSIPEDEIGVISIPPVWDGGGAYFTDFRPNETIDEVAGLISDESDLHTIDQEDRCVFEFTTPNTETHPIAFVECVMTNNTKRGEIPSVIYCDEFGVPDRPLDSLIPSNNVTTKYPSEFDTYTPPNTSDSSPSSSESYSSSSDSGSSSFD